MDLTTIIGSRLLAEATGLALKKTGRLTLGAPQERALGRAIRQAVDTVIGGHPEIGEISAEIDVIDDDVVREVVAIASGADPSGWAAAQARWRTLYETDPPAALGAFLTDLADEIARRLRGDPKLQPLFLVNAADVLVARTDSLRSGIDGLDTNREGHLGRRPARPADPSSCDPFRPGLRPFWRGSKRRGMRRCPSIARRPGI